MHISSTQVQRVFELHMHKVHSAGVLPTHSVRTPDRLTLSRQATEMHNIKRFTASLPDVRHDKVRNVRALLDSGAYQVSDRDLASKMLALACGKAQE